MKKESVSLIPCYNEVENVGLCNGGTKRAS